MNWVKMHQKNDLTQLSRTGKICKYAHVIFDKIRDEIIDTFGPSEEFLKVYRAQVRLELLKCELLHTNDRTLIFFIQIEEKAINDMMKPLTRQNDLFDAMVWIKKQQISFNENEVSTFWFLKYMDHLIKQVKSTNKTQSHGRR